MNKIRLPDEWQTEEYNRLANSPLRSCWVTLYKRCQFQMIVQDIIDPTGWKNIKHVHGSKQVQGTV